MKIKDTYEYRIPAWAICPIEYGTYDSLTDSDIDNLEKFIDSLEPGGIWEFGEYNEFSWNNDIDNLGGSIIEAKYIILEN